MMYLLSLAMLTQAKTSLETILGAIDTGDRRRAGWANSWDTDTKLACGFATYWKASEAPGSHLPEVYGYPEDPANDHATADEKCDAYAAYCDCETTSAAGHWNDTAVCDAHEANMGDGYHKKW